MRKIAFIPGNGIGIDVSDEAEKVLKAVIERSGLDLQISHFDLGSPETEALELPALMAKIGELRESYSAIFVGALDETGPTGLTDGNLLDQLSLNLDLYISYRPVSLLHPKYCPFQPSSYENFQFIILRDNLEGLNARIGGSYKAGTPAEEVIQQAIVSRHGIERLLRYAFEFVRRTGAKKLTVCSLPPGRYFHERLWRSVIEETHASFSTVDLEVLSLEAMLQRILRHADELDVIVTCNIFGDILGELGSEMQGGSGLTVEGLLNPNKISIFKPLHGAHPELTGTNTANPLAAISAIALMLEHLGLQQGAGWVKDAVRHALNTDNTTADLGGRLGTRQVGDFIADQIKRGAH